MEQNGVQSIERAFIILEALSKSPAGLPLMTISEAAGLHKSTAHRILSSLSALGYVKKDKQSGNYRLSLKMFEVSSKIVNELDIYALAKPHLDELSRVTEEAVHLVVRDGTDIVYIYKVDFSSGSVRMSSRVGLRGPMYCTAVGKCILAFLDPAEVSDIWAQTEIKALTKNTIVTMEGLWAQLAEVRKTGYAFDNEENELGVRCVAAPIFDFSGNVAGAFSVSVPTARINDQKMEEVIPYINKAKNRISKDMGYSPANATGL